MPPPINSRLLVVRHGHDRGPRVRMRGWRPDYCAPLFDDIQTRWPDLAKRIDFWRTGDPLPSLERVSAILFLLQDPLRENFTACFEDSMRLADEARREGIRIINSPEALSNTVKSTQARIWREHGLPTPSCDRYQTIDELRALAEAVPAPMIIKSELLHAQQATLVLDDQRSLQQIAPDRIPIPGSISPIVDTRSGYQALDPCSPYATHYHKKRAMVFGDRVQPNHVFFARQPVVGCVSSSFGHYRSFNPIHRAIENRKCRAHIQCDLEYHFSPCPHADLLAEAARVLGVPFCAIDYAVHADGRLELWEANPHFSLHQWPVGVLSRQRRLTERTRRIHAVAAEYFCDLLEVAP